jgi:hypothetical protein
MNSHHCHLESLRHWVSRTRSGYVQTKPPHFTAPPHPYSHNPPHRLSFQVAHTHDESWRNKGSFYKALVFIVVVPPDDHRTPSHRKNSARIPMQKRQEGKENDFFHRFLGEKRKL